MWNGKTIRWHDCDRDINENSGDLDFTLGSACGSKKETDSRYKKNHPSLVIGWGKREDDTSHDVKILTQISVRWQNLWHYFELNSIFRFLGQLKG